MYLVSKDDIKTELSSLPFLLPMSPFVDGWILFYVAFSNILVFVEVPSRQPMLPLWPPSFKDPLFMTLHSVQSILNFYILWIA